MTKDIGKDEIRGKNSFLLKIETTATKKDIMIPLLDSQDQSQDNSKGASSSTQQSDSQKQREYGSFHQVVKINDIENAKGANNQFSRLAKSSIAQTDPKQDMDDATAASAGFFSCCCCILIGCLIAGSIMTAYGEYKDSNMGNVEVAGRLLLVIFGVLLASVTLCLCLACCTAPMMKMDNKKYAEPDKEPKYLFKRLNDYFKKDIKLHATVLSKSSKPLPPKVKALIDKKMAEEKTQKEKDVEKVEKDIESLVKGSISENGMTLERIMSKIRPKVYVIDFEGDMTASQASTLREQVSLVLLVCSQYDQVVVNITSPGGAVSEYGLVASQLMRFKHAGLKLTVCVDTVAASGGYMAACVADRIIAAPFSFVGSIGVIAYIPNLHRVLQKHELDVYSFTSGQWKRTVDIVGPVTEEGKAKMQQELDDIYSAFKGHVKRHRPQIEDINRVATGEAWLAQDALALGLVDEIRTSDDILFELSLSFDVLKIVPNENKKWQDMFGGLDISDVGESFGINSNPSQKGSILKGIVTMIKSSVEAIKSFTSIFSFNNQIPIGGRHGKVHLV